MDRPTPACQTACCSTKGGQWQQRLWHWQQCQRQCVLGQMDRCIHFSCMSVFLLCVFTFNRWSCSWGWWKPIYTNRKSFYRERRMRWKSCADSIKFKNIWNSFELLPEFSHKFPRKWRYSLGLFMCRKWNNIAWWIIASNIRQKANSSRVYQKFKWSLSESICHTS